MLASNRAYLLLLRRQPWVRDSVLFAAMHGNIESAIITQTLSSNAPKDQDTLSYELFIFLTLSCELN